MEEATNLAVTPEQTSQLLEFPVCLAGPASCIPFTSQSQQNFPGQ